MRDTLRVAFVGSVDDGKSTLIGRLLVDTNALFQDHLSSLQTPNGIELSWVTDGLLAEREQGITIDVAYRHFRSQRRDFLIADGPGHEAHVGNMLSGASFASLAVVLIDAERKLTMQTYRHLAAAHLAGVKHLVIAVNKMDLVGYDQTVFNELCARIREFTAKLDFARVEFIPVSGLVGDGVVSKSPRLSWYAGETLLETLETAAVPKAEGDLRLPIQAVLKTQGQRFYAGRITQGHVSRGDVVVLSPSSRRATIENLLVAGVSKDEARTGDSVALSFTTDEDLSRGELVQKQATPESSSFTAKLVWISQDFLTPGMTFILRHDTTETRTEITSIDGIWKWPEVALERASSVKENDFANVHLRTSKPLTATTVEISHEGSRFVLIDRVSSRTVAAGTFLSAESETKEDRARTLWFTGLPGSGKTTLAEALQKRLSAEGQQAVLLDGDVLRSGLCGDLGFSDADRAENSRRVAEVCKLLNDSGVTAIVALISPFRKSRDQARSIVGGERFIEVFVDAPLAVCQARDPKGLYARASRGEIKGLTGFDAPYEAPHEPELHLETSQLSISEALAKIESRLTT